MIGQRGGKLTLEIRAIENKLVRVTVSDSGAGISAENLPRIFDPFFTTRASDRVGSGLGCPSSTASSRTTAARSPSRAPRHGTKFVLTFPADAGRAHRT
jgi:C4-dicarboxylate-specific signal transduction histidine kinase